MATGNGQPLRRGLPAREKSLSTLLAVLAIGTMVGLAGCHAVDFYEPTLQYPVPPEMAPPGELQKISLPAYQVEPPDLLAIEMLKKVPLPPYRIDIYDVLQVRVTGTTPDQPIDNYFLVEAEGVVTLGPTYGRVRVAGMTIEEATEAIRKQLSLNLARAEVSVQLARTAGVPEVTADYLVGPDGTINLKEYGTLFVAGKTVVEIRRELEEHLKQYFDSPEVGVEVRQFNSKVFYVITEGAGLGDNIRRLQVTGNDTVMDALASVGGLSQFSSTKVWIARPAPGGSACQQILPVDYEAITKGGSAATNYQIMPGDRVFIAQDDLIAANTLVNKLVTPVERLLGIASLGTSFTRSTETMGRAYNSNRPF